MTLTNYQMFNILFRNKVIYEMTLEDIELCKDMRVRPAFVRFPETLDFSIKDFINEKKETRRIKEVLKSINYQIAKLFRYGYTSDNEFIKERKELLDKHLQILRRLRTKRKGDKA